MSILMMRPPVLHKPKAAPKQAAPKPEPEVAQPEPQPEPQVQPEPDPQPEVQPEPEPEVQPEEPVRRVTTLEDVKAKSKAELIEFASNIGLGVPSTAKKADLVNLIWNVLQAAD
jgi:protein TonB